MNAQQRLVFISGRDALEYQAELDRLAGDPHCREIQAVSHATTVNGADMYYSAVVTVRWEDCK